MSVAIGPTAGHTPTDGETVAAVDDIDGRPHLVVADISRDDAWIAIATDEAVPVEE